MERIAGIHAVYIVSTRRVTDSTEVVCMVVKKGSYVKKVFCSVSQIRTNTLFTVAAFYII